MAHFLKKCNAGLRTASGCPENAIEIVQWVDRGSSEVNRNTKFPRVSVAKD